MDARGFTPKGSRCGGQYAGSRVGCKDPERKVAPLVKDATLRFDLTPRESEYLLSFYRDADSCQETGRETR